MNFTRCCALIDSDALMRNVKYCYQQMGSKTPILCVIKADAYGHGAVRCAKVLEDMQEVAGFGVATASEALELYDHHIHKMLLVLSHVCHEEYTDLIKRDIRMTISSLEMAEEVSAIAVSLGKRAYVHLKVDTGMGRIGIPVREGAVSEIIKIKSLALLEVEGIYTHFARADEEDKNYTEIQNERFAALLDELSRVSCDIPMKHCNNSAAIMYNRFGDYQMVRLGITLYGIMPSEEMSQFQWKTYPVMSLKARITYVKKVEAGIPISYGGTYVTQKEQIIATVSIGYGDGYPRSLSNAGYVLVRGNKAPIIGRICMDQMMIDVTELEEVKSGDEVTLLGKDGNLQITMEELGALSRRFPYEFACDISQRVPRCYL